jgi:AraC family transcriptional regulator of adaptative response/methylated-DNA-[protein]-cysteine methyltransferase
MLESQQHIASAIPGVEMHSFMRPEPYSRSKTAGQLKVVQFATPLGPMLAIGDDHSLYLLEFMDRKGLDREVEQLHRATNSAILPGEAATLHAIQQELARYFEGELELFSTPIALWGTVFQQRVWQQLCTIPYGQTIAYRELAQALGSPTACRAVAGANSCNHLALIVPCHRVINSSGALGGYAAGADRKEWLLAHERQHRSTGRRASRLGAG